MSKHPRNEVVFLCRYYEGIATLIIPANTFDPLAFGRFTVYTSREWRMHQNQVARLIENQATISFRNKWDQPPYLAGKVVGTIRNQHTGRYTLLFTKCGTHLACQHEIECYGEKRYL